MKLSVVIPVYNETHRLRADHRVRAAPADPEIILVDDCSTDGTRHAEDALIDGRLTILYHDRNRGKGRRCGPVSRQRVAVVIIQDADLEYDRGLSETSWNQSGMAAPTWSSIALLRGPVTPVLYFWHPSERFLTLLSNCSRT